MTVNWRNGFRSLAKLFPFVDPKFQVPFDIIEQFETSHTMFALNQLLNLVCPRPCITFQPHRNPQRTLKLLPERFPNMNERNINLIVSLVLPSEGFRSGKCAIF